MRRGMTMIEVLVALALLAGLSVAAAGWIELSARVSGSAGPRLAWERAARAVLQRISDDLATGDEPNLVSPQGDPSRIETAGGRLSIRTRLVQADRASPGLHDYRMESGNIWLTQNVADAASRRQLVLGDVAGFTCELDVRAKRLFVRIEQSQPAGDSVSTPLAVERSYRLP